MKMLLKKEVKHSVVYETQDEAAAVKSVYVMKDWLRTDAAGIVINDGWPKQIELTITEAA